MTWTNRTYPTGYLIPTPRVHYRTFDPYGHGSVDRIALVSDRGALGTPQEGPMESFTPFGAVACPPVGSGDTVMAVDDDGNVTYGTTSSHAGWLTPLSRRSVRLTDVVDEDGRPVPGHSSTRWFLAWGKPEQVDVPADEDEEERTLRRQVQDEEARWKGILFHLMAAAEQEGTQSYVTGYITGNDDETIRETLDSDEPVLAEVFYHPFTEAMVGRRSTDNGDARINGIAAERWDIIQVHALGSRIFSSMTEAMDWWNLDRMGSYINDITDYRGGLLSTSRGRAATIRPKIAD